MPLLWIGDTHMLSALTLGYPARHHGKVVDVLGERLVRDLPLRLGWRSGDGTNRPHI